MRTRFCRVLPCLLLACAIQVLAGEATLPPVNINSEAGEAVEHKLDTPFAYTKVQGVNLPAGLRMAADGTVVGKPVHSGQSAAKALFSSAEKLLAQQDLLFNIGAGAGARSAGGIAVLSRLNAAPRTVNAGAPVSFTIAATQTGGSALTYAWNFGDGTTASTSTGNTSHIYAAEGNYTVSVTVSDSQSNFADSTTVGVVPAGARIAGRAVVTELDKKTKVTPFEQLILPGTYNPNSEYNVRFYLNDDIFVDVDALEVNASFIAVMVPPLPVKTAFKGGKVTLKLVEDGAISEIEGAIKVNDLPKFKTKTGDALISFLSAQRDIIIELKPKLQATGYANATSLAQIDAQVAQINTLIAKFVTIMTAKKKDKMALDIIKQSDRLILGIISGASKTGSRGFADANAEWLDALQSGQATRIAGGQAAFATALLSDVGARANEPTQPTVSDGIKFTTGTLGVLGGLMGAAGVVANLAGATVAGAGLIAGAAAIGTVAVVVGVTAGVAVGIAGAVGSSAGSPEGTKLLTESKEIFVDTGKNILQEKIPGVVGGKIIGGIAGNKKVGEEAAELISTGIGAVSGANDVVETLPVLQSNGTFTAALIRSGSSYYVIVKSSNVNNAITVTVNGSDGYSASFNGTGMVTTSTIPAGAVGVTDTIVCRDTITSEQQSFAFTF